jgi:hypothetical protein
MVRIYGSAPAALLMTGGVAADTADVGGDFSCQDSAAEQ